jgi:hypothetical protein
MPTPEYTADAPTGQLSSFAYRLGLQESEIEANVEAAFEIGTGAFKVGTYAAGPFEPANSPKSGHLATDKMTLATFCYVGETGMVKSAGAA